MSRWFRHYAGMMSDPKFGAVARRCKRCRSEVLFVWGCILESAAEDNSPVYTFDADAIAELMGVDTRAAQEIHDELVSTGLLKEGRISQWESRQFTSDSSTERSRKHREASRNAAATLQQQHATPPDTDTDTDTDTEKKKTEQSARARATRWPADAVVPEPWVIEAEELRAAKQLPPSDLRLQAEKFQNYWASKSGGNATKIDWRRTWLNWCLEARNGGSLGRNPGQFGGGSSQIDELRRIAQRSAGSG